MVPWYWLVSLFAVQSTGSSTLGRDTMDRPASSSTINPYWLDFEMNKLVDILFWDFLFFLGGGGWGIGSEVEV